MLLYATPHIASLSHQSRRIMIDPHLVPQVGFRGVLLYATPYMVRVLMLDADVAAYVETGELVLMLWDMFSKYQPVIKNQVS